MKVVRGIIGGVVFGVVNWLLGGLFYGLLFNKWIMMNASLWRPMDSPVMQWGMPLANIFSGLMIALVFAVIYRGIPGTGLKKGLIYGFLLWLIARFAGEFFMYTLMPYSFMLVVAGWLHGICGMLLGGILIAAIYGKSLES
jgi:hypothetical protein